MQNYSYLPAQDESKIEAIDLFSLMRSMRQVFAWAVLAKDLKSCNEQRGFTNHDGDAFRRAFLIGNSYRSILERNVRRLQKPSNYMQVQLTEGVTAERSRSFHVDMEVDTPTNWISGVTFRPAWQEGNLFFFNPFLHGPLSVPPSSLG